MDIPKKQTINLIRFHAEGDTEAFETEAKKIARDLYENGEEDLARYVIGLFSESNYIVPQKEI